MRERKELNVQIGDRIKRARENAGMTQERLASYIDVSVQYVSDLERGVVGASVKTIIKIATILKVSCDFLLLGKETGDESPGHIVHRMNHLEPSQQKILDEIVNLTIRAFST